jgi:hypothetical protein
MSILCSDAMTGASRPTASTDARESCKVQFFSSDWYRPCVVAVVLGYSIKYPDNPTGVFLPEGYQIIRAINPWALPSFSPLGRKPFDYLLLSQADPTARVVPCIYEGLNIDTVWLVGVCACGTRSLGRDLPLGVCAVPLAITLRSRTLDLHDLTGASEYLLVQEIMKFESVSKG